MKKTQITIILMVSVLGLLVTCISLGTLYFYLKIKNQRNYLKKADLVSPPDMSKYINFKPEFETQVDRINLTKAFLVKDPETQAVFMLSMNPLLVKIDVVPPEIVGKELPEVISAVECSSGAKGIPPFRLETILPGNGENQRKDGQIAADILAFPAPDSLVDQAIPLRIEPMQKYEPIWINIADSGDPPDLQLGIVSQILEHRIEFVFRRYFALSGSMGTPVVDKEGRLVALHMTSSLQVNFHGVGSKVLWIRNFQDQRLQMNPLETDP